MSSNFDDNPDQYHGPVSRPNKRVIDGWDDVAYYLGQTAKELTKLDYYVKLIESVGFSHADVLIRKVGGGVLNSLRQRVK